MSKEARKGSRDLLLKFWDALISLEPLELENSNLACGFISRVIDEKNAKLGQKESGRGHVTCFWTVEARNVKFDKQIYQQKFVKGCGKRVTWPTIGISGPLHISGTVGARNVKFGKQVHQRRRKKCKIRSKPLGKGLRDVLLQFWYPLNISGTVRARNYKFGCRLIIMGSNERNAKLGKGGRKGVTWPTFEILGPHPYFGNGWSSKR